MSDNGSEAGLAAVLLAHRQNLLRFLRARGAADSAEDLLQDLWLKVEEHTARPISQPLPYLYRMAENLMRDRLRSETSGRQREREWTNCAPDEAGNSVLSDRALIAQEQLENVEATLSALGERTSKIFHRFRLDGATQHQVATELGISLSAVEKHLQKAYRALLELKRRSDAE